MGCGGLRWTAVGLDDYGSGDELMTECLIALGGNMGDVASTFAAALELLAGHDDITVRNVSRCFVTEPVGSDAGDSYLNAAARLETTLDPTRLLEATKQVEAELGRGPHHATWAPRSVDLDLITCGNTVLENHRLKIPHPGCWYRRFVLDPLCRIAPTTKHPILNRTFEELRNRLLPRPLPVWLDLPDREQTIQELRQQFPQIHWASGPEDVADTGLTLPGSPAPPDSLVDVLAAATGSVELANPIPNWPESQGPRSELESGLES